MALLGLLLEHYNAANVRRVAEETTTGLLVVDFTFQIALATNHFTTTGMKRSSIKVISYKIKAIRAMKGIIVGVDDALQRNQGR